MKFAPPKSLYFPLIFLALSSCQASDTPAIVVKVDESAVNLPPIPSVSLAFSCIPDDSAHIAAHRGTDMSTDLPENALESLKHLYASGVRFAEIDVARLKDGTHILFHDGVWDERSTGKGPIAATQWPAARALLLHDSKGKPTNINPSQFADILAWAKNRMYLEIDFKSSANTQVVIDMIKAADMMDQVILIAYDPEQAIDLHRRAPEAVISVSIFNKGDLHALQGRGLPANRMAAWVGKGNVDPEVLKRLKRRNIPILMGSFYSVDDTFQKTQNAGVYQDFADAADLIVSDVALSAQSSLDQNKILKAEFEACIREKQNVDG